MITLHSIDLTTTQDACFASIGNNNIYGCRVLDITDLNCGTYKCPFYKPKGCKDWVRIEDERGINIIPPEEYKDYYRRNYEHKTRIRR